MSEEEVIEQEDTEEALAEEEAHEEETWEQKYQTLQGKYDAEVPRLRTDLEAIRSDNERLRNAFATIPQQQQQAAPEPQFSAVDRLKRAAFGDDEARAIDETIQKMVTQTVSKATQAMESQFKQYIQPMQQQFTDSAENMFWAAIQRDVPNWEAINNDPGFNSFIQEPITPGGNITRFHIMRQNQTNLNPIPIVGIFQEWESKKPAGKRRPAAPGRGRGRGPTDVQTTSGKTYTRKEVADFYSGMAKLVNDIGIEEVQKREADILKAHEEGRVID